MSFFFYGDDSLPVYTMALNDADPGQTARRATLNIQERMSNASRPAPPPAMLLEPKNRIFDLP